MIAAAFLSVGLVACNKEKALETDASFTVKNIDSLRAGTLVNFIFEGSGEFATFYSGVEGSVWGDSTAKGTSISEGSFTFRYSAGGEYIATVVATSNGNWAEEEIMDVQQQTLTVVDKRCEITKFVLNDLALVGTINGNEITFLVSDVTDLSDQKASWDLTSDDSKVYVNGVEQEEKKTLNDYSSPVIFDVVAPDGTTNSYTVTVNTYESNTDADILTLGMVDHLREADLDAVNKDVYLFVPIGTDTTDVKIYATVSDMAAVHIGSKEIKAKGTNFDLSKPVVVTVTAESGATNDWDLYTAYELAFTEFKFSNLNPAVVGDIDVVNLTVNVNVLEGTDLTDLVADFTLSEAGTVEIGSAEQTSGVTSNDFSNPVTYELILAGGKTYEYTITVNTVSK